MDGITPQTQYPYPQRMPVQPMQVQQPMPEKKAIPAGVKVISVLSWIGGILNILGGILLIVGAQILSSLIEQSPLGVIGGTSFLLIFGIITMLLGILYIFVGRGLWKGRNWARIVTIIFSILGVLIAIILVVQGGIFNGILSILVSGWIGGYLLFSRKVKEAFAKIS